MIIGLDVTRWRMWTRTGDHVVDVAERWVRRRAARNGWDPGDLVIGVRMVDSSDYFMRLRIRAEIHVAPGPAPRSYADMERFERALSTPVAVTVAVKPDSAPTGPVRG